LWLSDYLIYYHKNDLTNEIIKEEGYKTKEQLLKKLKSHRLKLPKEMWFHDLNMKINFIRF